MFVPVPTVFTHIHALIRSIDDSAYNGAGQKGAFPRCSNGSGATTFGANILRLSTHAPNLDGGGAGAEKSIRRIIRCVP
jgi:hypothetical protein